MMSAVAVGLPNPASPVTLPSCRFQMKPSDVGEITVEQADAVDPEGMQQCLITAREDLERTAARRGDAVGDIVADAVRRIDQRIGKLGEEIAG